MSESKFLWKNSQDEDVGESSDRRPVYKFDGCLETLPVGLSEMPTRRWWGGSLVIAREMSTLTSMLSEEPIGAEEEQQIFSGKFVKIRSGRDIVPLVEIRVRKLTDWVSSNESQKAFAEVPWQVREVPTPSQLAWWQLKSPHMRKREFGWEDRSWSMFSDSEV